MPCNCDYMDPSKYEIEASRIYCIIDELDGKGAAGECRGWEGFHPLAYGKLPGKMTLDKLVRRVCERLHGIEDVSSYSLELQMWWRDHQRADAERQSREAEQSLKESLRDSALGKLTIEEREALGL